MALSVCGQGNVSSRLGKRHDLLLLLLSSGAMSSELEIDQTCYSCSRFDVSINQSNVVHQRDKREKSIKSEWSRKFVNGQQLLLCRSREKTNSVDGIRDSKIDRTNGRRRKKADLHQQFQWKKRRSICSSMSHVNLIGLWSDLYSAHRSNWIQRVLKSEKVFRLWNVDQLVVCLFSSVENDCLSAMPMAIDSSRSLILMIYARRRKRAPIGEKHQIVLIRNSCFS